MWPFKSRATASSFGSNAFFPIAMLLGSSMAVSAGSAESINLAVNIGTIIASEDFCGLRYSPAGIKEFINKRVREDDIEFSPMLNLMTEGQKSQLREMPQSQKVAHCAQIERSARAHGFLR